MSRFWARIFLILTLFSLGVNFQVKKASADEAAVWMPVAPGIAYREFHLDYPNRVYVARLDRSEPSAILDTAIAAGSFSNGLQTVRDMAVLYDQSVGYWGREWESANYVKVAINGFFYDPDSGFPWSGQVISGWYAKRFDELQSGSSLVWTFDRNLFVGECVVHPASRQVIRFLETDETLVFDSINAPGKENSLVIYTSQFGPTTPADTESTVAVVQLEQPLMIMPAPAMNKGVIVHIGAGQSSINFDQIVLVAKGKKGEQLLRLAKIGEPVGISQELKHYRSNCNTPHSTHWENVYAATGASFVFLKEGKVQPLSEDLGAVLRAPRTAIAFNDRFVFFLVVDGRDRYRSLGMSMAELGFFAKMSLGANWGAAMDGGGSSTMVVNDRVVNHPLTDVEGEDASKVKEIERAVSNGWLMISVHPEPRSSNFGAMDPVLVSEVGGLPLRSGPGISFTQRSFLPYQSTAMVVEHPLNGIYANGVFWWKIQAGDNQGWVAETGITRQ